MTTLSVELMTCARIPTDAGLFQLCYYANSQDDKEHLALVCGDVAGRSDVLVRVHSECFTGDLLGSLRCDCGPQLQRAMELIAAEGCGVIVYLRQEGRGIGLLDKLRAYNLQDAGYDTVDANLLLGHQADARDYTLAALILQNLQIESLRLLTNNPGKIESLQQLGLTVTDRIPLEVGANHENTGYLQTKVTRMRHLLNLDTAVTNGGVTQPSSPPIVSPDATRPSITLSYAQSLDGSITTRRGRQTAISGPESLQMTHQLRAAHDAILVGINTVLADDPRLTARLTRRRQPRPVVVDSRLRTPLAARLFKHPRPPLIATTLAADPQRQAALEATGVTVLRLPATADGRVSLPDLVQVLPEYGIRTLMVEGGAAVIGSFLAARLADQLVITLAPALIGGLKAVDTLLPGPPFPRLIHTQVSQWGEDIVLRGQIAWDTTAAS